MRKILINIIIILVVSINCFGQGNKELLQGQVTFITSNNVYVKFDNTENITIGDTLMLKNDSILTNCLIVTNKSSISCVCKIINNCNLNKDELIYHHSIVRIKKKEKTPEFKSAATTLNSTETNDSIITKERIKGRISAASYSNIGNSDNSLHRTMYRFSLNADHIDNSKFSIETYLNYRQNFLPKESTSTQKKNYFNVYNLALRYDARQDLSLIIGRKININASSLGAIDGLQAEKYFSNFYIGIIAGFRPDIYNHGFNSDLLEYGTYIGLKTDNKKMYSKTTLGILEQKNNGYTDRRYSYFQHSSTIGKKLNLFSSFEIDLFNEVNGHSFSNARLTNFFISSGYRLNRKINLNLSYDSRKRVLYYETLKTDIEQLLEDDESRQGARMRVSVRPVKYVSANLSYSQRFQSNQQNKSNNISAYISLSKIPSINGSISVNFNKNKSNYLESDIVSIRHSRYLIKNKVNSDFYFRTVNYNYLSSEVFSGITKSYKQNYYGTNISYIINRKLSLSVLAEVATISQENNYRINTRIIKRFGK